MTGKIRRVLMAGFLILAVARMPGMEAEGEEIGTLDGESGIRFYGRYEKEKIKESKEEKEELISGSVQEQESYSKESLPQTGEGKSADAAAGILAAGSAAAMTWLKKRN